MTIEEAKKIEERLWQKAVSIKLDECEFDVYEYLSEKDADQYEKARKAIYGE